LAAICLQSENFDRSIDAVLEDREVFVTWYGSDDSRPSGGLPTLKVLGLGQQPLALLIPGVIAEISICDDALRQTSALQ
jgi:hypothetical protein